MWGGFGEWLEKCMRMVGCVNESVHVWDHSAPISIVSFNLLFFPNHKKYFYSKFLVEYLLSIFSTLGISPTERRTWSLRLIRHIGRGSQYKNGGVFIFKEGNTRTEKPTFNAQLCTTLYIFSTRLSISQFVEVPFIIIANIDL